MGDLKVTREQDVQRDTTPLYVCIYLPEFPVQARLRLRPKQSGLPVVVLDGDPPLEQVCSANHKALGIGITHGMTKAEMDAFDGLCVIRRSTEEEHTARTSLLGMAGVFTPRTQVLCISPANAADFRMVLDMSGSSRMFGYPAQLAESISRSVKKLGLQAKMAVSANFQAAVCASAFAGKDPIVIPPGSERTALNELPISALGLSEAQRDVFDSWGIRTCGELAQLTEMDLVTRLGQEGKRLLELANGNCSHFMIPEDAAFKLEERVAFDSPEERLDSLLFVLGPMLGQLILCAQNYALAVANVTIRLALDGGGEHIRTVTPALPVSERKFLLKLVQLDMEAHPPAAGVLGMHVHAEPGQRSKVQTGLFSLPLPEPMRLDVTLARIAALVGQDRVGRAHLLDTHHPDAFAIEPFTVPTTSSASVPLGSIIARRRLRPPMTIQVRSKSNAPAFFFFQGQRYSVKEAYGPWRRSGDWWSECVWSREEWDVCATTNGGDSLLCTLTQDLLQGQWRMEAFYD